MPRILITGAAGFLGSHLCDRFISEGYQVVGMDNLLTGNLDNIKHLFPLPEFEYYHHDITKFVHVPGPLDYILHFASPASPTSTRNAPIRSTKRATPGSAREESRHWSEYRYTFISSDRETDFSTFRSILAAERCRSRRLRNPAADPNVPGE